MLIRRVLAGLVIAAPLVFAVVTPAQAAPPNCGTPENPRPCELPGTIPGRPGSPTTRPPGHDPNPGPRVCQEFANTVDCYKEGFGSYNDNDGCYYRVASPQPAPPAGAEAGSGAWYERTCGLNGGPQSFTFPPQWMNSPPQGVGMTPEQLARYILARLVLKGASIQIRPEPTGKGLVGMPVWMWTTNEPARVGPITDSETDYGLTVSLTATVDQIVWNMGDGGSKTCSGGGTPYNVSMGMAESPDCGYKYKDASRNRDGSLGSYRVTATSTWSVDWQGGGESGTITVIRFADNPVNIQIEELQVVSK